MSHLCIQEQMTVINKDLSSQSASKGKEKTGYLKFEMRRLLRFGLPAGIGCTKTNPKGIHIT